MRQLEFGKTEEQHHQPKSTERKKFRAFRFLEFIFEKPNSALKNPAVKQQRKRKKCPQQSVEKEKIIRRSFRKTACCKAIQALVEQNKFHALQTELMIVSENYGENSNQKCSGRKENFSIEKSPPFP